MEFSRDSGRGLVTCARPGSFCHWLPNFLSVLSAFGFVLIFKVSPHVLLTPRLEPDNWLSPRTTDGMITDYTLLPLFATLIIVDYAYTPSMLAYRTWQWMPDLFSLINGDEASIKTYTGSVQTFAAFITKHSAYKLGALSALFLWVIINKPWVGPYQETGMVATIFFNPACVFVQVAPSYAVFVAFCSQERVAYNAFVLTTVGALAFGGIWSGLSLSLAFLTIWAPFSSSLQSNPIAAYSLAIATNHAMVFQQLIFLADAVTMFLMTPGVEARDAWMCSWGVGYVNYKIFGSTLFAFVNICGSGGSWQRLIVPVVWLCVDGPLLVGLLTTCGEYGVSYWILAAQWPVAVSSAAMYLAPWMIRQLI